MSRHPNIPSLPGHQLAEMQISKETQMGLAWLQAPAGQILPPAPYTTLLCHVPRMAQADPATPTMHSGSLPLFAIPH